MGAFVTKRAALAIATLAVAGTLAGCASEPVTPWPEPPSGLGAVRVEPQDLGLVPEKSPKKTVATKVLSAMAFERVTGLKADPARLLETE
jgi:hypothetical protein